MKCNQNHVSRQTKIMGFSMSTIVSSAKKMENIERVGWLSRALHANTHTHSKRERHTSKCALKLYALHQMSDVIVLKWYNQHKNIKNKENKKRVGNRME